jgi:hypothetical protein
MNADSFSPCNQIPSQIPPQNGTEMHCHIWCYTGNCTDIRQWFAVLLLLLLQVVMEQFSLRIWAPTLQVMEQFSLRI